MWSYIYRYHIHAHQRLTCLIGDQHDQACWTPMGLCSGMLVSDVSPIRHVSLHWVSNESPIIIIFSWTHLKLYSQNSDISRLFVNVSFIRSHFTCLLGLTYFYMFLRVSVFVCLHVLICIVSGEYSCNTICIYTIHCKMIIIISLTRPQYINIYIYNILYAE